jgi:tetratricopeptide (TPR) repeat protein
VPLINRLQTQHLHTLQAAQAVMRTGKVEQAYPIYEQALNKDLLGFYQHPQAEHLWHLGIDSMPSLDKVALSSIEYYVQNLDWLQWNPLCQVVLAHPHYPQLSLDTRTRLEVARTYSLLLHSVSLDAYIVHLESLLRSSDLDTVTVIMCHYVMARMYLLKRMEDKVRVHLQVAEDLCAAANETFYQSFVLEANGTVYYFLNQRRRAYYEKALELYQEAEVFVRSHNDGMDYIHSPYNLGWVYAEMGEFKAALAEFQRGFAEVQPLSYIGAQYQYGTGYVYLWTGHYAEALDCLTSAINFFWDRSYVNTAACLNLVAEIYRRQGNITAAIDRLENAAANLQRADHPVQLHHIYYQFSKIYFHEKNWWQALRYFIRTYRLRFKYGMPLLPY